MNNMGIPVVPCRLFLRKYLVLGFHLWFNFLSITVVPWSIKKLVRLRQQASPGIKTLNGTIIIMLFVWNLLMICCVKCGDRSDV